MKLLLVGVGPGIGLSVVRRFGREGFEVHMIARSAEKLTRFERELAQEGIRSFGYSCDIADESAFGSLLHRLVVELPDLEVLHYNASAFNPALPTAISLPVFHNDFRINVVGALMAVQAFVPTMKQRRGGTVFITGGGSALRAPAELASLSIGKAGVRNLAFCLAEECGPHQVRVGTITVCGAVQAGTKYDPDRIADLFWQMYQTPLSEWRWEMVI
ncbi:MAG: SDR family NAD(P)-dependent oxidoreductase [Saprospiraceae bacterium]|nr:SDR family NAD(P)-dependent oxidoreductase [Saprospiraceae bacterium]MDW8482920.1 SDR family NAD(P)-dependent oxidoreductase [Saprospiraceae bacterium]